LVIVAVQVTVLAPPVPDPSHWVIVVGNPVLSETGAVAVQVSVPPGPPDSLHWMTLWPPGPPVPTWLPLGVEVQVTVPAPGLVHCRISASVGVPSG
jgi:hypothetical protein